MVAPDQRDIVDDLVSKRRKRSHASLVFGSALLITLVALSMTRGAVAIPPSDILDVLKRFIVASADAGRHDLVIINIRLPRTVLAMMVGAALALSLIPGLWAFPPARRLRLERPSCWVISTSHRSSGSRPLRCYRSAHLPGA
jgi:hypothetical protein